MQTELLSKIYPSLLWQMPKEERDSLYLTFDDGPIPELTPWVLDILKEYNAKATFFCVGENVKKYPAIYQRILDEGHSVGNHTFNHVKGWKMKARSYIDNVKKAERMIESKLFRPPYGKVTRKQIIRLKKLGYRLVMWNVLTRDYDKRVSKEKCLEIALKATSGSIIVFHDNLKASRNIKFALPKLLASKVGFRFNAL